MFRKDQPFRKTTRYEGEETNAPVDVFVVSHIGEDDEGDRWRIRLPQDGKAIIVYDCDLHPAPDMPETMPEKFARLTDGFESPLVMAAAVEAICNMAKDIAENEEAVLKSMEGGMVHGPAWVAAAKRAAEIVDPTNSGA